MSRLAYRHGFTPEAIDDLIDTQAILAELVEPQAVAQRGLKDRDDLPVLGTLPAASRIRPLAASFPVAARAVRQSGSLSPEQGQKEASSQGARIIFVTLFHPPARNSARVGQRVQAALSTAAALAAISLSPGSAQAYVVTVGGVQYDVTTFTGTYNSNASKFATPANGGMMPWYDSSSLASQFALAVGLGLGSQPGCGSVCPANGPLFPYNYPGQGYRSKQYDNNTPSTALDQPANTNLTLRYAVGTVIPPSAPAPLPLFGAAAAFGYSRKLTKRIQVARSQAGAGLPLA